MAVPDRSPSNPKDSATLHFVQSLYEEARKEKRRKIEAWNSYYKLIRNESWSSFRNKSLPAPQSSEIFPTAHTLISYITDQYPTWQIAPLLDPRYFQTLPPQELADQKASDIQEILKSFWVTGACHPTVEKCLWDTFTFGAGIAKDGFDPTLNQGEGDIFLRWVDPYRFAPDPNATSLEDASYVVEVSDVPLFEIKARFPERGHMVKVDENRKPTEQDTRPKQDRGALEVVGQTGSIDRTGAWPGTAGTTNTRWAKAGENPDDYTHTVRLTEVWVRETERYESPVIQAGEVVDEIVVDIPVWRYIACAGGVVLTEDTTNPFDHGELPYTRLPMVEMGGEFWPPSLSEHLRPNQIALNRLLAAMQNHAEICGNPIFLEPDQSGIAQQRVVNRPGSRLTTNIAATNLIRWLDPPNMSPAVMQLIGFHRDTIDRVSGISAVARGSQLRRREPAAAVDAVQEASFVRVRAVVRNYEEFLRKAGNKLASNIVQFYIEPRTIPVIGAEGVERSITIGPKHFWVPQEDPLTQEIVDDAPLRFTSHAMAGSAQPLSKQARAADAQLLYEGGALAKVDLLKAHDWADPEGTVQRAMDEQGITQAAEQWNALQEKIQKKSSPI